MANDKTILNKRSWLVISIIGLSAASLIWLYPTANKAWKIAHPQIQDLPLHPSLLAQTSTQAQAMERQLTDQADLSILRTNFQAQQYASYCGVASSVIVLKSLGIKPLSQDDFFSPKTKNIHSAYSTFFGGMTLAQLGGLLHAHGAVADVFHAEDSTIEDFRRRAAKNLQQTGDFVLVNYLRKAIHQERGGHISPLAAYDKTSDRFLVLDVAVHKYPPVWVKTADLWKALLAVDSDSNRSRGYVLVRRE